jgi:type VI secretion system secreted protein VgrG
MPQFVYVSIKIDGQELAQVTSFHLSQRIYQHHSFRVICPYEALDGPGSTILHSSKNSIGSTISIKTEDEQHNIGLNFSGVITQVEGARQPGELGNVIISGYSATICMENGPHCQSWEEKTVSDIASDIVAKVPQNLLNAQVNATYDEILPYTVQYGETGWEFLCRLCATFGEWLYYDGEKLVIGPPKGKGGGSKKTCQLESFNLALQLRPLNFDIKGYDYINADSYNGSSGSYSGSGGLSEWGDILRQKSMHFYGNNPSKQWNGQFLSSMKQLNDYTKARTWSQSSNMVRLSGASDHPELQVGSVAHFEGNDSDGTGSWESLGDYTVISVDHYCDGHGGYSNSFTAIPASNKMPPIATWHEAHCETQSALVTDNNDSGGLGRVRVRFYWMESNEKSPWLRITSMHGGGGKGSFFIPEIGEEVLVGFEDSNPEKPFIIGSVYNGKAKADFSNDKNDLKIIRTRSGNRIIMNDKDGSLNLVDQKDNKIQLDGSGNINVSSSESIVLSCGNSMVSLKKDGTIEISGKNITIKADEKAKMTSGQASFSADSQGNAKVEGMTASVSGDTTAEVKGGAQTNVSASGEVAIKGAMIMLN